VEVNAAAQLLEFDKDGKYLREIGHNLYAWSFAHTVRVDKDDNIWAADKGSDMVIKFNPEGQVIMVSFSRRCGKTGRNWCLKKLRPTGDSCCEVWRQWQLLRGEYHLNEVRTAIAIKVRIY